MRADHGLEVRRPGLLVALEDDADVGRERHAERVERVHAARGTPRSATCRRTPTARRRAIRDRSCAPRSAGLKRPAVAGDDDGREGRRVHPLGSRSPAGRRSESRSRACASRSARGARRTPPASRASGRRSSVKWRSPNMRTSASAFFWMSALSAATFGIDSQSKSCPRICASCPARQVRTRADRVARRRRHATRARSSPTATRVAHRRIRIVSSSRLSAVQRPAPCCLPALLPSCLPAFLPFSGSCFTWYFWTFRLCSASVRANSCEPS